jgi:protein deglycase
VAPKLSLEKNRYLLYYDIVEETMKFVVPLAEGFEESEAIIIIDILRRAGLDVTVAALSDITVTSSRKIRVTADARLADLRPDEYQGILLPGGMPGSRNLRDNDRVMAFVQRIYAAKGIVGAICAAPMALGRSGVLDGKKATCFPGCEKDIPHANITDADVVVDGNIITGRAMGSSIPFALKAVAMACGEDAMIKIREAICYQGAV